MGSITMLIASTVLYSVIVTTDFELDSTQHSDAS